MNVKTNHTFDVSRRRFLRGLGLGAGAAVLGPIASGLYQRAMGQQTTTQRLLVVVVSGFPKRGATGKLLPSGPNLEWSNRYPAYWGGADTTNFSWPSTLPGLAPFRDHSVIVDGLLPLKPAEGQTLEHGGGYGVLTGTDMGLKAEGQLYSATIGGPSIDQHIASGPSGAAPFPSILFGVSRRANEREMASVFAARKDVPRNHVVRANVLEEKIFGNLATSNGPDLRRQRVLDVLKDDIRSLEQKLAVEEKVQLTEYLNSIAQFDARREDLAQVTCERPGAFGANLSPEQELASLFEVTGLAMKCGITHVAGCAAGGELAHVAEPSWDFLLNQYHVHKNNKWTPGNEALLAFLSQQIRQFLEALSGQPGTMPENTTVVVISDRGLSRVGNHHGSDQLTHRWPAFVLSSNPKLHTGGRYLRPRERAQCSGRGQQDHRRTPRNSSPRIRPAGVFWKLDARPHRGASQLACRPPQKKRTPMKPSSYLALVFSFLSFPLACVPGPSQEITPTSTPNQNRETNLSLNVRTGDSIVLNALDLLPLPKAQYTWSQVSGPSISIPEPHASRLEFVVPFVPNPEFAILSLLAEGEGTEAKIRVSLGIYPQENRDNSPTCTDGMQNGSEAGIDCGGGCAPCPTAPTCDDGIQNGDEAGTDCGGDCEPCSATSTCEDEIQNGNETGIDCGGDCEPCPAAPTCDDGVQNGNETGIDCDGDCEPCPTAPTCSDGIQNGDETGTDCGGSCPTCPEESGGPENSADLGPADQHSGNQARSGRQSQ